MTDNPVFDSVRQLLSQGDTAQALQVLIAYLEKERKNPDAVRTLRVVEANYSAARQQELKGILDFSEAQRTYSKTNDALLSVLEDIAAGRKPGIPASSQSRSRLPWLIGGGVLLVAILVTTVLLMRDSNPPCPNFQEKRLSVMLLPFQKLRGDDANPAASIQTRIRDLTRKNQIEVDVEILQDKKLANSTPDIRQASDLAKHCQANMVIWGQYEQIGDSIAVDVRFTFPNRPAWMGQTEFRNFAGVAALQSGKSETLRGLDDAVFSLCTALAIHADKPELAEKWLGKVTRPEKRDVQVREVLDKMKERTPERRPLQEKLKERRQG